jgi:tRNA threonylcarbamoyladenosine dehydratase
MKMGKVEPVLCVYSTEKPGKIGLADLDESKVDDADQYASLPNFRSRILPVLGTMPALFGNAMATHVLTELAGFETRPIPFKATRKQIEKFYNELCQSEMNLNEKKRLGDFV